MKMKRMTAAFVILSLVAICLTFAKVTDKDNQDDLLIKHIQSVLKNHFEATTNSSTPWWLIDTSRNFNSEEIKELNGNVTDIMACMPKYKDLNTTTKRIYIMMTNASWAVYQGVTNRNLMFQAISDGGLPIVMLVPAKLDEEPLYEHSVSMSLFCVREKGMVFIPGINASAVLLAAFYYHEFGHLLQSKNMDQNLAEVKMHTLSINICLHGKPEYNKKIQEIIHRRGIRSFEQALSSVTEKDLEEMDDILLPRSISNKRLSVYMAVQHLLAVGFAYEDHYESADPAHKAEIYKFVIGL